MADRPLASEWIAGTNSRNTTPISTATADLVARAAQLMTGSLLPWLTALAGLVIRFNFGKSRLQSIERSLAIWISLLALVGLSATYAAVLWMVSGSFSASQQQLLLERRMQLEHRISDIPQPTTRAQMTAALDDILRGMNNVYLVLESTSGETVYRWKPETADPSALQTAAFEVQSPLDGGASLRGTVGIDNRYYNQAMVRHLAALGVALALAVALLVVATRVAVRRGLAPLRRFTMAIGELDANRIGSRIDERAKPEELTALVAQFNALLSRVGTTYRELESSNARLADRLSEPLSELRRWTLDGVEGARSSSALRAVLARSFTSLKPIQFTIDDVLLQSRARRGLAYTPRRIDSLSGLVDSALLNLETLLQEVGVPCIIDGDASAYADEPLVARALVLIIGEASIRARQGTRVRIGISTSASRIRGTEVRIAVQSSLDTLDGRTPSGVEAPSKQYRHRIGLSVAALVAARHGTAIVDTADGDRAEVGFTLPSLKTRPEGDFTAATNTARPA